MGIGGSKEKRAELDYVVMLQGEEINQGIVGQVRWGGARGEGRGKVI